MRPPKLKVSSKREARKVSAEARLLHSQFSVPAQSALATVQQALAIAENLIGRQMAQMDGVEIEAGWRLDLDAMEWVKMPVQLPEM